MGDNIQDLPLDPMTSSNNIDLEMVNTLFQNKEKTNRIVWEFKDSLIGGLLFLILANHNVDKIIHHAGCENPIILWAIKFILFVVLFYILKNRFTNNH